MHTKMSAEDNENIERITTTSTLAEELLREMPDMKDEIEMHLNMCKDAAETAATENDESTAAAAAAEAVTAAAVEKSKNNLDDLKRFRLLKKRSDTDFSQEKEPKVLKLDSHVTERKSIIEIRLNNEAAEKKQRERDLQELDHMRKLKEQAIIDLGKITQKEEQLQKLETVILKQEQDEKMVQKILEAEEAVAEKMNIEEKCIIAKEEIDTNQKNGSKEGVDCELKTGVQQSSDAEAEAEALNLKEQSISVDKNVGAVVDDKVNDETTATAVAADDKDENDTITSTPKTAPAAVIIKEELQYFDDNSNNSNSDNQQLPEQLNAEEEARDQELRASRATFLQHLPCFKLHRYTADQQQSVPKCRECRRRNVTPQTSSNDVYCRFYEFRKLQYNVEGDLLVAGFPNPYTDPTREDLNIWQPDEHTTATVGNMDIQVCRYILLHAGDQFCYLWRQEAEALKLHENPNSTIAWKKVVQGIREICDVCDTTLFNYHWTCDKCGFGVCLDCFKDRKEQRTFHKKRNTNDKTQRGHDEFHWLLCTATTPHQQHAVRDLMLTQIIAGDSINVLGRLLHDIRALWQVPQVCGCLLSKQQLPSDSELSALIQDMIKESQLKQHTSDSSLATEETMRKQLRMEQLHSKKLEFARAKGIDYVPGRVWTKQTLGKDPITTAFDNFKHINFLRKGLAGLRRFLPPRAMTLAHSTLLAPGVQHEWLCDGKLLRLTNAMHPDNRILYQEVWKCGQPVMISEVARSLNLDLWRPEAFCRDFGDKPNDLINCLNGNLVPNQPMRHFWEGFQCIKKRLLDHNGRPMLLKLKDWPPGDDFAEILPTRFADLMKGLPMPEYTLRTGNLNIASCLPRMFVPPDLGPKMYNAYGSALHPDKGTTNLHLDISDAVNIMVYVGIPQDSDSKSQLVATQRAIAMGGCDYLTRARSQSPNVMPGALWHIFPARDADKIRDLLNRVTLEKGFRLEPDHDPIHDQNWYLDDKLRARLFKEYGVEGYPIVQCLGDAVFIPAGAPHQVQNLHNCIKVAEDFVSPENITHCYHLTHEFRRLSHSHTNHEDKLQIKNIIYHAIKDCCHILVRALHERIDAELEKQAQKQAKIQTHANDAVEFISNLTSDDQAMKVD